MKRYFECQVCREDIVLHGEPSECECPSCGQRYYVDSDADYRNGMWHDLTSLSPIKAK